MSTAKPYNKDSLERALKVHGVTYARPGEDRPKWYIDAGGGRDMTDREVYAFLAGFKLAKDRHERQASRRTHTHVVAESFCNECEH